MQKALLSSRHSVGRWARRHIIWSLQWSGPSPLVEACWKGSVNIHLFHKYLFASYSEWRWCIRPKRQIVSMEAGSREEQSETGSE